jgi:hypothetical protein
MKNFVLFLTLKFYLTFVLIGCGSEGAEAVIINKTNIQEEQLIIESIILVSETEENTEEFVANIYEVYYNVLSNEVDEYGIVDENDESFWQHSLGLHYAEIIDFDNNGTSELLYIVGEEEFLSIYIYGFKDEAIRYFKGESIIGLSGHNMFGIAESNTGIKYLSNHNWWRDAITTEYYILKEDIFENILEISGEAFYYNKDSGIPGTEDIEGPLYFVNGEEVSQNTYETVHETKLEITSVYGGSEWIGNSASVYAVQIV